MSRVRSEAVKPFAEETSVSENLAGSEPLFVRVSVPLRVSPGLRLVRLKIAWSALELEWVRVPAVTALMVLPVVLLKVAPEPTATAPAATRVASGMRTLRDLSWCSSGVLLGLVRVVVSAGRFPIRERYEDQGHRQATAVPQHGHTGEPVRNASPTADVASSSP